MHWMGSQPLPADRVFALTRPPPNEIMRHEVIPAVPRLKKALEKAPDTTGELELGL